MIQGRLSASFALLATFVLAGCATPAEKEQRVLAQLSAPGSPNAPEKGVLLLIATVNGQECETSSLVLGRLENGTIVRVGEAGGYYCSPVPAVLPGGEYIVGGIGCKQFRNRQNFNGLHGRVTVKAGEVVNAGVLDIGRRSDGVFSRRER